MKFEELKWKSLKVLPYALSQRVMVGDRRFYVVRRLVCNDLDVEFSVQEDVIAGTAHLTQRAYGEMHLLQLCCWLADARPARPHDQPTRRIA